MRLRNSPIYRQVYKIRPAETPEELRPKSLNKLTPYHRDLRRRFPLARLCAANPAPGTKFMVAKTKGIK